MTPTQEQVLARIGQIPSLSVVVQEVLASFDNEKLETAYLVSKLNQDQALAARVLRVANSPFYGLNSSVATVSEAVVVLGFHAVRSLALAASIVKLLPDSGTQRFDQLAFWRHAVGTGVCARVLAGRIGLDQEAAFTAGLLHDIGKLALSAYFPDVVDAILARRDGSGSLMVEAERSCLGFDHAAVGHDLAQLWHFPEAIRLAIRDHHAPERAPAPLTDIVHVANTLCYALDIGSGGNDRVPPLAAPAWARLGIAWEELGGCLRDIENLDAGMNLLITD
ncbi:MAG: HDOD domain-containing protein [Rhodocyclales bacterium]|nr:HDOD domain-containing protein [Rhodocyclales bacterium]